MYGLILENMVDYIKREYGDSKWDEVRRAAQVDQPSFSVHQVYPENLIPRLAKSAFKVSPSIHPPHQNFNIVHMQWYFEVLTSAMYLLLPGTRIAEPCLRKTSEAVRT